MEFNDFIELISGKHDDNTPKASLGFYIYRPVPCSDGTSDYEMSISDALLITKPFVRTYFTTDMYRSGDFVELALEFPSGMDPNLMELWKFLERYEDEVDKYYEDDLKRPAMSVLIMPSKKKFEEDSSFLEFQMPLLLSLSSAKPGQVANEISLLFQTDNCSLHEEEYENVSKIKQDIAIEREEAKKKEEELKRKREEELELKRKSEELEQKIIEAGIEKVIRINRKKEENENENS